MLGQNGPCLFSFGCGEETSADTELIDSKASKDKETSESEKPDSDCSKSCLCSCCGNTATVFTYAAQDFRADSSDRAEYLSPEIIYTFLYHQGIWHPPSA